MRFGMTRSDIPDPGNKKKDDTGKSNRANIV